jgi:hypothetical protein
MKGAAIWLFYAGIASWGPMSRRLAFMCASLTPLSHGVALMECFYLLSLLENHYCHECQSMRAKGPELALMEAPCVPCGTHGADAINSATYPHACHACQRVGTVALLWHSWRKWSFAA